MANFKKICAQMPDLCPLRHQGLWKRLAAIVTLLHVPSRGQVMGPMAGPAPGVHCQRQRGVRSKHGINMQMGREEEGGAGKAGV